MSDCQRKSGRALAGIQAKLCIMRYAAMGNATHEICSRAKVKAEQWYLLEYC